MFFTHDIRQLARWLFEIQSPHNAATLTYHPLVKHVVTVVRDEKREIIGSPPSQEWAGTPALETFDTPHLGVADGDISLTQSEFTPILHIDLPIFDNIDFGTLFKLISDYPTELGSFRDFLYANLEEMRMAAAGSEQFVTSVCRLEREIKERVRKLDSDCREGTIGTVLAPTGCTIATWTLAVYCLVHSNGKVLTTIGPSGLANTVSTAYSDYLTKQLQLGNESVYFLWLIGTSGRTG